MESLWQFEHKFTIKTSFEQVAAFHEDPKTLKILTPPPMFVTINKLSSIKDQTILDFNIWFGPLPIRWVAGISHDEKIPGFADRQLKGPFDYWEHRHIFREIDPQTTEVIDQIKAHPGKKFLNRLISRFMWLTLPVLFAYRAWRTHYELAKNLS